MSFIAFILAFAFSAPVGYFTAAWTLLAIVAAVKGFPYLWGVAAIGAIGLVAFGLIAQDPPDADWPGVGFVEFSLLAYGVIVFVICLLIAAWRRDRADRSVDQELSE